MYYVCTVIVHSLTLHYKHIHLFITVPDSCHDATEAMQKFTTGFERRYGNMHPLFFIGSLKEAVQEATAGVGDVREREGGREESI